MILLMTSIYTIWFVHDKTEIIASEAPRAAQLYKAVKLQ